MTGLMLDGSYGEGGGQILRTALSASVINGRAFRLFNIRAKRRNPGLLAQHLSAVRAAAQISGATLTGDYLTSTELSFAPSHPPQPGNYVFDVVETAGRGSAGSASLILQTLAVPLALADGVSKVFLRGGTHVEWAPSFDDLVHGYFPALRRVGIDITGELIRYGWYPVGGGELVCDIGGRSARALNSVEMTKRGRLQRIFGRAIAAILPAHIPQRMADRARTSLSELGVAVEIEQQSVRAACAGAGIFLVAEYDGWPASFSAYGRLGMPSEAVADRAIAALREHHASQAAVEVHLADQLLLPLAISAGSSVFTTLRPSGHLTTNAWTIGQFGIADISVAAGPPCVVKIKPTGRRC
jgi:RNA 3'-terminal phosphate cyclase (ATP)